MYREREHKMLITCNAKLSIYSELFNTSKANALDKNLWQKQNKKRVKKQLRLCYMSNFDLFFRAI